MLWNVRRNHGIQAECISPKDFENRETFNEAFLKERQMKSKLDLDRAGRISGCDSTGDDQKHITNRIINIHPSLIPSFCGTGFYGLKGS